MRIMFASDGHFLFFGVFMSSDNDFSENNLYLEGVISADHADDVRAQLYTKPHLVFRADHYFLDYWLPLLGPSRAWLVVAMQQSCWTGSRPGSSMHLPQDELGQQCDLGRQRVNELLADPLVGHFINSKQVRYKAGRRLPNRYEVQLTSPLIPAHAAGLQREIAIRLDDGETLAGVLASLIDEAAAARKPLLARLTLPHTPDTFNPYTITEIVQGFTEPGQGLTPALRQQVKTLAGLLLQPEARRVEEQYLRLDWLPWLGPAGTWLVMVIRRDCFANDTETRTEFSVSKAELAERLGVSRNTLGGVVKNEYLPEFFSPMEGDLVWQPGRYRLEGRVRMYGNPLAPPDKQSLVERLDTEPPKDDTATPKKATRLEVDAQKDDTATPKKATRLEVDAQKSDTATPKKATRLEVDAQKGDSDSAPFKDSALIESESDYESLAAAASLKAHVPATAHAHEADATEAAAAAFSQKPEQPISPAPIAPTLPELLRSLYRQTFGCAAPPKLQPQLITAAIEIPDAALWERAFAEAAVSGGKSWKYVRTIADRMRQEEAVFGQPPVAADNAPTEAEVADNAPTEAEVADTPVSVESPLERLWADTQTALSHQMTRATFDAHIRAARLVAVEDQVWTLAALPMSVDWLENRLYNHVQKAATVVAGYTVTLKISTFPGATLF